MPKAKKDRVEELEKAGDKQAEKHSDKEERDLMGSNPRVFSTIEVSGGFRVAKNRQWVSGVLDSKEATMLASDMNRKDPEQKPYNRYLMGNAPAMRGKGDIQGLGE